MPQKYKNKYRIESIRLQNWDYGWNAAYFVTMCTQHRKPFFGNVANGITRLTNIGCLAWRFWCEIPDHFSFVDLGPFVVMPNHVHGIVVINKPDRGLDDKHVERRQNLNSTDTKSIGQKRFQNQGKNSLSSIIGSYKSVVSKHAHKINPNFGWQPLFYEHIIWDERAYNNISNYINDNPKRWGKDKFWRSS